MFGLTKKIGKKSLEIEGLGITGFHHKNEQIEINFGGRKLRFMRVKIKTILA